MTTCTCGNSSAYCHIHGLVIQVYDDWCIVTDKSDAYRPPPHRGQHSPAGSQGENRVRKPTMPGVILRRELEARGWTQKDLAEIMERPEKTISQIVNGRKQITPQTALGLAAAFGTSAELWLHLEADYRLALARGYEPAAEEAG